MSDTNRQDCADTPRRISPARALLIAAVAGIALWLGFQGWRTVRAMLARAGRPDFGQPTARAQVGRGALPVPVPPNAQPLGLQGVAADPERPFARFYSSDSPERVAAFYRARMAGSGWSEHPLPLAPDGQGPVLAYSNARGDLCMISLAAEDGGTRVGIQCQRRFAAPAPEPRKEP